MTVSEHLITLPAKGYSMITGISRFTKGEFNQVALDEVYNKGKELYKDTVVPPSSGLIENSLSTIWDDMHEVSSGYPAAETKGRDQYIEGHCQVDLNTQVPGAAKINAWYELLEGTDKETNAPVSLKGCQLTGLYSTNTMVEISRMSLYWMDTSNVWHKMSDKGRELTTPTHPQEGSYMDNQRGCNIDSVQAIRTANKGYSTNKGKPSETTYNLYPKNYYWTHGAIGTSYPYNRDTIKAVYAGQYARVVLIDPTGADDRHSSNFVLHVSSDIKSATGTMVPGYEMWGVGGISKYKKLPTNGDWMPINFLDGFATFSEVEANPPPFMTNPY